MGLGSRSGDSADYSAQTEKYDHLKREIRDSSDTSVWGDLFERISSALEEIYNLREEIT